MLLHRKGRTIQMVDGPILPNIVRYTIPLMLSGMLQLLYNMADIIVVGRFDSAEAIASVGATSSLINLMINIFMGLAVGTSVLVAQRYGADDHRGVREAVHTSVALSLIMGLAVGVFGFFSCRALLEMMDTPTGAVLDGATLYMRIYFLGMPGNMLYNFGAAVLRAVGDTKKPLYYLTIAGLVNVVLNLIFVIVFKMGVAGVAIATIVSQYISAVLVVLNLMRSHTSIHLNLRDLKLHRDRVLAIARVGLPAGLQGTIFSLSNVMIQSSVNSFQAIAMAGNAAASNIENFVYTSMNAVYQSALTFTSQNVGARRYDRLRRIMYTCLGVAGAAGIALGLLALAFSGKLLSWFMDPGYAQEVITGVIAYGQLRMRIICTTYFLCGAMDVMVGVLRGMGSAVAPMIISTVGVCATRILWIYTVFAADRRPEVLYISYPISWGLTGLSHYLFYLYLRKRRPWPSIADEIRIQVPET